MKKLTAVILSLSILLCGCNHSNNTDTEIKKIDFSLKENTYSSELSPQYFKETGFEISDNNIFEKFFVTNNSVFVLTTEIQNSKSFSLEYYDINSNKLASIDTEIQCSYVSELCCLNDRFIICYEKDGIQYLSSLNLNGETLNTVSIGNNSSDFDLYCTDNTILLAENIYKDDNELTQINIYDKELKKISDHHNINTVTGSPLSAICGIYNNNIDITYLDTDSYELKFLTITPDFQNITPLSFSIAINENDITDVYTLANGNILVGYSNETTDTDVYEEYNRNTGSIEHSYEIPDTSTDIFPGNNLYAFFYLNNEIINGFSFNGNTEQIESNYKDEELSFKYNKYTDNIVIYSNSCPKNYSLFQIENTKIKKIAEFPDNQLTDIYVSLNNTIYSLFDNIESEKKCTLQISDTNGKLINSLSFPEIDSDSIRNMCTDSSENLFFLTQTDTSFILSKYSKEGTLLAAEELPDMMSSFSMNSDNEGNIIIYASSINGNVLFKIKDDTVTTLELNENLKYTPVSVCSSYPTDELIFSDYNGIYTYSSETDEIICIANWNEFSCNGSISSCAVLDNNTIIYYGNDYLTSQKTISVLTRSDEPKSQNIINLAVIGEDDSYIRYLIQAYNRNSKEYIIKRKSYLNQNKLDEDIGKGSVPDIIYCTIGTDFDIKKYIAEKYIAELDQYFYNDKEFNSDDYYINLLKSDNGKIYQLAAAAGIEYMQIKSIPSQFYKLSYNEFFKLPKSEKKDLSFDEFTTKLINCYVYQNIDYQKQTFEIDDNIFESMLIQAKNCYSNTEKNSIDYENLKMNFHGTGDFLTFSDSDSITTYPDGDYHINLLNCFMIMNNSHNKEEDWKIIKDLLSEKNQNILSEEYSGFPLLKSSLIKSADYQNKKAADYHMNQFDDNFLDSVINIMQTGKVCSYGNSTLKSIVEQNIEEYCTSNKSSDDTIAQIKSEIRLFLDEN